MTGFGSGSAESGEAVVTVEIRTVNSRHLKWNIRLPPGHDRMEPGLRERLGREIRRGHVDVAVRYHVRGDGAPEFGLDEARVEALLEAFRVLKDEYAVAGVVDLALLARLGIVTERPEPEIALDEATVAEAGEAALRELIGMRVAEGERLEADLRRRLERLREGLAVVGELAPRRLEAERERLRESVEELLRRPAPDDDRLAREIALIADRWDLGEEIVRARSHVEAFEELLRTGDGEAVGKRLGFLGQELLRELNTIGAKANDAAISHEVVEMKNEIESLREQIENVE